MWKGISIGSFEKIPVIMIGFRRENCGSAFTVPGLGIFCASLYSGQHKQDLLRHEFGHILQARYWGWYKYLTFIAVVSLRSYFNARHAHQSTWTEWTANRFSWKYFGRPADWNMAGFPVKRPCQR